MIGFLLYLSTYIQLDIVFVMSSLTRYLTNPSPEHIKTTKHIFYYFQGTIFVGITYRERTERLEEIQFHGYINSD
jgi:hypothetical protein